MNIYLPIKCVPLISKVYLPMCLLRKTLVFVWSILYNSDLIPQRILKHVCRSLLTMFVKNVEFRFNNIMYRQTNGVEMDSPL